MRFVVSICALALASSLSAQTYIVPVVTAQFEDRVYTTTLALRNDGPEDVRCEAIYAVPTGGTLRTTYTVPRGGKPRVEEDVLMEAGAVGTMRLACSERIVIAARIQASKDRGRTFDEGRTFAALDEAASFRRLRTVSAQADLLVAEVAGSPVTLEAIVKNDTGTEIGRKTYEIPAFAQQIVNLSKMREDVTRPRVELRIVKGTGSLVVGEETTDPGLLKMALRMTPEGRRALDEHRARQLVAAAPASLGPGIAEQLLVSSFKAAPFRDPAVGLIYMRDRWYDPSTGTFLTPDPEGYADSANPYVYCAGDPVNCSDPTGDKVQFKGKNPRAQFELFKRSLHNSASAALLDLDVAHGNIVVFKKGVTKEQFIKAALPQWPYFEANERDLGIPVSTDKRSIEEKYASLITSPRLVEITAEPGAAALEKPDAFLRFFGVKSIPHKAAAEGGGVTLFASESVTGNISIAIDPDHIKLSGPTIASWYGVDAYDTELVLTHELGHALADIEGVAPCRQTWSVYLENQMRSRMGHYGNLRYSEFPVNKDPNSMRCGHEESLAPGTKKP